MTLLELVLVPLGWVLRGKRADERNSVTHRNELTTTGRIDVTSPAFADGRVIPARYCGRGIGDNISPALRWASLPQETHTLLLIIEDVDTPSVTPGIHTIAFVAPDGSGLAEGALTSDNPRIHYLPNHRGRTGYVGPRPLPGHGRHRYRFHLYALDKDIEPNQSATLDDLLPGLSGHVLAVGRIEGTRTS